MVIGEVNNAEDRPKIFPQEIMELEEAPKRFSQQIHLRLSVDSLTTDSLDAIMALVKRHKGSCPLYLCFPKPDGNIAFVECHETYGVTPGLSFQNEIESLLGPRSYYVKADRSLPERQRPKWERARSESTTN